MHDISKCKSLIETITTIAEKNDAIAVDNVTLEFSPYLPFDPVHFAETFRIAAKGTVADGIELLFAPGKHLVYCTECNKQFGNMHEQTMCPECHQESLVPVIQNEMILTQIKLAEPVPQGCDED